MNDNYHFFLKGPLSQWYMRPFKVLDRIFNCAEQYMMYKKARLFNDQEKSELILASTNPKHQKMLGRIVSNFDLNLWNQEAITIMYNGNYAKFTQHLDLKELLLDTAPKLLAEANPYDNIWGIGLSETSAKLIPENKWPGKNWLGFVLTQVRTNILKGIK